MGLDPARGRCRRSDARARIEAVEREAGTSEGPRATASASSRASSVAEAGREVLGIIKNYKELLNFCYDFNRILL